MKNRLLICSLAVGFLTGLLPASAADSAKKIKCTEVIAKLEGEIAKEPARVLLSVEDALNANDSCACQIIKAAIVASKADPKLVGEIVSTAINAAPTAASTIGECALAASPEAASEIKTAMQAALGQGDGAGKEPISSGKEPISSGKEPISAGKDIVTAPPATVDNDFDSVGAVSIQGIYFSAPGGGGGTPEKETIIKVVRSCDCRCKKKPHTGSSPATGS